MSDFLIGERVFLRSLAPNDISITYADWLNNPDVNQYLETRHSKQDLNSIRTFIEEINAKNDEFLFGIFVADSKQHIGNIKVGPIKPFHRVADVSLFIGEKNAWGKGYAAEAIKLISAYAFEVLNLLKLSSSMYAPNIGSTNAFKAAGYKVEGLRERHLLLNGEPCDVVELGLVDPTAK